MSLEELARQIKNCQKCQLYRKRIQAVPGEGNPKAEIIFIGEAPGQKEDEQGRPFVGEAGKFLEDLLQKVNLDRGDVYITNIVKCRPPANRDPYPQEIRTCLPYLKAQIKEINPRLIVTLGRYSLSIFFPQKTISRAHGKLYKAQPEIILEEEKFIYPLYHPAAALHQNNLRETIINDFRKIPQILKEINPKEKPQQAGLF